MLTHMFITFRLDAQGKRCLEQGRADLDVQLDGLQSIHVVKAQLLQLQLQRIPVRSISICGSCASCTGSDIKPSTPAGRDATVLLSCMVKAVQVCSTCTLCTAEPCVEPDFPKFDSTSDNLLLEAAHMTACFMGRHR